MQRSIFHLRCKALYRKHAHTHTHTHTRSHAHTHIDATTVDLYLHNILLYCSSCATQTSRIPHLVHAVLLCDHITGCEAFSFTTDGYGIFNVCTN